jgi:hypothetical protein
MLQRMTKRFAIGLMSAALLASGCASYDGRDLVPGVATEADIVGTMGKPAQTLRRANGEEALYFSKLPYGRQMFVAATGPDGRLKGIEQVLDYEHIERIRVDTTTADQMKEILGPPYRITRAAFKPLDVWEYPWRSAGQARVLWVSVSDDGIVREVLDARDPEAGSGKY